MGVGKNSQRSGRQRRRIGIRRRLRLERLTERRVLATITGMVFDDANLSMQQEANEVGLGKRLLYLDTNNNGAIETGEPFALGSDDGSFEFTDLADGTYYLRLYNGTDSQRQSFPSLAEASGQAVDLENGIELAGNDGAIALTEDSIEVGNFLTGQSQSISVGLNLTSVQSLPDGNLVVTGGSVGSTTAWHVNPWTASVTPIDLSGEGNPVMWSQLAIDRDGYGIALAEQDSDVNIRAIDASNSANGIAVSTTYHYVPADTQVITSATGNRSVLAWPGTDGQGLELTTWSNSTATWISQPISIPNASDLVAFDDSSGLLVIRNDNGGVTVHDADANFANLQSLPGVTGPVTLDGERDLLLTMSTANTVQLYDVRDGELIADLALKLDEVGTVSDLRYDGAEQSLVLLGSLGMAQYSLTPAAHQITITDNEDPDPVSIGLQLNGNNAGPYYQSTPSLQTNEDTQLLSPAPGVLTGAIDDDGDSFVVLVTAPPRNGTATIQTDGGLRYDPHADFFGVDTFAVFLHDGRDSSGTVPLQIQVNPVPDPPTGINVNMIPIPENAAPGFALGPINVIDVDLNNNHVIQVGDNRFVVHNGQLIFVEGALNFELEPVIDTTITFSDPNFGEVWTENILIEVLDAPDPITDITPAEASVLENQPGHPVVELTIWDEDTDANATLTVDDDRFIVEGHELRLADGIALDYEEDPQFTVNVTATDGDTFTKQIEINVVDLPEPAVTIELTPQSVMELSPGHAVGNVVINGQAAQDSYSVFVSDQRFEISGSQLKLIDDQWVDRATQTVIQLTLTVQDKDQVFPAISQTFSVEVTENPTPYHNDESPFDVDGNDLVTTVDALLIINYLNTYGPGPVGSGDPSFGYDVNGDGFVTALDALLILNQLNIQQFNGGGTVGGGEKEGPEGELVQPQRIATPQPQDLILPQHIANEDRIEAKQQQVASDDPSTNTTPSTQSAPLQQYQPNSDHGDDDDDEFASNVDEALDSLLGNSYLS
jgi:WD40 repeat protein